TERPGNNNRQYDRRGDCDSAGNETVVVQRAPVSTPEVHGRVVYRWLFRREEDHLRSTKAAATPAITSCDAATPSTVSHATAGSINRPMLSAAIDKRPIRNKLVTPNAMRASTALPASQLLTAPPASPTPNASPMRQFPSAANTKALTSPAARQIAAVSRGIPDPFT